MDISIAYLVAKELSTKYIKPKAFQKAIESRLPGQTYSVIMSQGHELKVVDNDHDIYVLDTLAPSFQFDAFDRYVDEAVEAIALYEQELVSKYEQVEPIYDLVLAFNDYASVNKLACGIKQLGDPYEYRLWIRIGNDYISKKIHFAAKDTDPENTLVGYLKELTCGIDLFYDLSSKLLKGWDEYKQRAL